MYRITGIKRQYSWGSKTAIQEFLGLPVDGKPLAEVWFGAHPSAPASALSPNGSLSLEQLIQEDPEAALGEQVNQRYGATLPYLVKLLAPDMPVSLQVHPSREQSKSGFEQEEAEGVPIDAYERTYKDPNHKPEMVFALTPFEGLVSFRSVQDVIQVLAPFTHPVLAEMQKRLRETPTIPELRSVFQCLVELPASDVDEIVREAGELAAGPDQPERNPYATAVEIADSFPSDAGVVASLLMHRVVLSPGQAVFVNDGVPHAYLQGLCLEVMANSDNVLRAGLTSKYIDVEALVESVDFEVSVPHVIDARATGEGFPRVLRIEPPVEEFALTLITVAGNDFGVRMDGPRIVLCTEGTPTVSDGLEQQQLERGEAVFIPAVNETITLGGEGTLAVISSGSATVQQ